MERSLASIRRVADIIPIEGADAIECVVVDGWKVVAKKGEFVVGSPCIYFEIDSVLPIREEYEFLRRGCYVKKNWLADENNLTGEGFRLKTIRLRGQISQGLVIPLDEESILYNGLGMSSFSYAPCDEEADGIYGLDITALLGVAKWDPPLPATLSGRARGNFPSFIPKTDQERIQNLSERHRNQYAGDTLEVTIKLDGSSMTAYGYNGKAGVCSRNLELDYENSPDTTFAKVFIESGLKDFLETNQGFAIQGELMGPGIQGNRENLKEHKFFVYDIYDINEGRYLPSNDRLAMFHGMTKHAGVLIEHCPMLGDVVLGSQTVDEFLTMAEGPSLVNPIREGIVFKSVEHPEFSFKAISNQFLLKGGE